VLVALICLSPVLLLFASLVASPWELREPDPFALLAVGLALWFAVKNFYRSFIRDPLLRAAGWTHIRNVSAVPVLATLLMVAALLLDFGSLLIGLPALGALVLDTGGVVWFLPLVWSDADLWGDEVDTGEGDVAD